MAHKKGSFRRDGFIGFRCPVDFEEKLKTLAQRKLRDASSLAIEFMAEGMERMERDLQQKQLTAAK